jgi:hypothetical protein
MIPRLHIKLPAARLASIGVDNANCAPAQLNKGGATMTHPPRFEQLLKFEYRQEDEAIDLRKQAEGMAPCIRRDELLRKAAQIDEAAEIKEWLISSGLRAPT